MFFVKYVTGLLSVLLFVLSLAVLLVLTSFWVVGIEKSLFGIPHLFEIAICALVLIGSYEVAKKCEILVDD